MRSEIGNQCIAWYDLNHASAVPSTSKYDCSRAKRISWSVVSKAADRSSNVTTEIFPSFIWASRSLVTRVRAVPVLCPVRSVVFQVVRIQIKLLLFSVEV